MASTKKEIKEKSLNELRKFISTNNKSVEEMKKSEKYISFFTHFLNKFEKDHVDKIINMILSGATDTEIKEKIKAEAYAAKNTDELTLIMSTNEVVNIDIDVNKEDENTSPSIIEEAQKASESEEFTIFIKTEQLFDKTEVDDDVESETIITSDNKDVDAHDNILLFNHDSASTEAKVENEKVDEVADSADDKRKAKKILASIKNIKEKIKRQEKNLILNMNHSSPFDNQEKIFIEFIDGANNSINKLMEA